MFAVYVTLFSTMRNVKYRAKRTMSANCIRRATGYSCLLEFGGFRSRPLVIARLLLFRRSIHAAGAGSIKGSATFLAFRAQYEALIVRDDVHSSLDTLHSNYVRRCNNRNVSTVNTSKNCAPKIQKILICCAFDVALFRRT